MDKNLLQKPTRLRPVRCLWSVFTSTRMYKLSATEWRYTEKHEREFSGASSPVANVKIKPGKLTMRCSQREVYSPLVSFKPTSFSPVNLGHMSAPFFFSLFPPLFLSCNVQMFHLKTSERLSEVLWIPQERRTLLRLRWSSLGDNTYI